MTIHFLAAACSYNTWRHSQAPDVKVITVCLAIFVTVIVGSSLTVERVEAVRSVWCAGPSRS